MNDIGTLLSNDPYQNQSYATSDGFPPPYTSPDQTPATVAAPVPSSDTNPFDNIWSNLKAWDANAGQWVSDAVHNDYESVKNAANTVLADVGKPLAAVTDYATNKIILIVAVLAVGLYLVGKGGAVKANVII